MTQKILTEETPKEIEESKERKNYFNFFSNIINKNYLKPGHLYKYSIFLEFESVHPSIHPIENINIYQGMPPYAKRIKIDTEELIEVDRDIELMRNK